MGRQAGRQAGEGRRDQESVCLFIPHTRPSGSSYLANLFSGLRIHFQHTYTRASARARARAHTMLSLHAVRVRFSGENRHYRVNRKSPETEFFSARRGVSDVVVVKIRLLRVNARVSSSSPGRCLLCAENEMTEEEGREAALLLADLIHTEGWSVRARSDA